MANYAAVKERVSFADAIRYLNIELLQTGDQWRGKCPVCETTDKRPLSINRTKGFRCFASDAKGSVIDLVAHVRGKGIKDAAEELAEHFNVPDSDARPAHAVKPSSAPEPEPTGRAREAGVQPATFHPLSYLEHDHDQVDMLGLSEIAEVCGIGWASKGILRQMVAVPIRKPDGSLVGYIGVTECRVPKQWHL